MLTGKLTRRLASPIDIIREMGKVVTLTRDELLALRELLNNIDL